MLINIHQLKQLDALKAAIKGVNRGVQLDKHRMYQDMSELYKPLIDPIKEIVPAIEATPAIEAKPAIEATPAIEYTSAIEAKPTPAIEATPTETPSGYRTLRLGHLADKYLKTPSLQYDHAFGLKPVEGSTNFRLGRMDVKIDGDDLEIDEQPYKGTEGLWKLLTRRMPGEVSEEDLAKYQAMIKQTRAYLREDKDLVRSNRSDKYKHIIKPIYEEWRSSTPHAPPQPLKRRRIEGTGVVFLPTDPDELLKRHKLLFGAYQAGNTGVFNELQAINDKLLGLDIFDLELVARINARLNDNQHQPQ